MQEHACIPMGMDDSGRPTPNYSCRSRLARYGYYPRFLALYYPLWLVIVTVVLLVYFKRSTDPSPFIVIFPATTFVAPLFFAALFFKPCTQPRSAETAQAMASPLSHHMHRTADDPSNGKERSLRWRVYNRSELAAATQNFDDANVLGAGGEATVFKGIETATTGSSRTIAVKRYYHNAGDLDELERANVQFKREVQALTRACHHNVVYFYGYCIHGRERFLVYEFMPNGSLHDWLFARGAPPGLTWDRRLIIAQGAARGLDYLHNDSTVNLIHLDMKPENILLDEKLNAKVADFGLSKLIPRDQTRLPGTTLVGGTPGYLPPEFSMIAEGGENFITKKADVYSFGIVLLQLVSGRTVSDVATMPPIQAASPLPGLTFRDAAFYLVRTQQTHRLLDASLQAAAATYSSVGMKMAEIGATCVEINPVDRPDMRRVRDMLEKIAMSIDGQHRVDL